MYKLVIYWKNPGFSALIFIALELLSYLDFVHYLPAVLLICNGILLVSMKNNREYTLQCFDNALFYAGYDSDDFDEEKRAAEKYANQKYGKIRKEKQIKKNKWSIMHKIKVARYQFYYNKFSMGFHQKKKTKSINCIFRTIQNYL